MLKSRRLKVIRKLFHNKSNYLVYFLHHFILQFKKKKKNLNEWRTELPNDNRACKI